MGMSESQMLKFFGSFNLLCGVIKEVSPIDSSAAILCTNIGVICSQQKTLLPQLICNPDSLQRFFCTPALLSQSRSQEKILCARQWEMTRWLFYLPHEICYHVVVFVLAAAVISVQVHWCFSITVVVKKWCNKLMTGLAPFPLVLASLIR